MNDLGTFATKTAPGPLAWFAASYSGRRKTYLRSRTSGRLVASGNDALLFAGLFGAAALHASWRATKRNTTRQVRIRLLQMPTCSPRDQSAKILIPALRALPLLLSAAADRCHRARVLGADSGVATGVEVQQRMTTPSGETPETCVREPVGIYALPESFLLSRWRARPPIPSSQAGNSPTTPFRTLLSCNKRMERSLCGEYDTARSYCLTIPMPLERFLPSSK